jgi:hypothetical protein
MVEGATAGNTFRLEVIICVEYQPGVQSDAYRLAKVSKNLPIARTITETQVKATPTAVPDIPGRR